jgi:hypothetical protein
MTMVQETPNVIDPKRTIEELFGTGVSFILRVRFDSNAVDVNVTGGSAPPAGKAGFPKSDVALDEPIQITILPWEASPGCRTVIVNGVAYERCS